MNKNAIFRLQEVTLTELLNPLKNNLYLDDKLSSSGNEKVPLDERLYALESAKEAVHEILKIESQIQCQLIGELAFIFIRENYLSQKDVGENIDKFLSFWKKVFLSKEFLDILEKLIAEIDNVPFTDFSAYLKDRCDDTTTMFH